MAEESGEGNRHHTHDLQGLLRLAVEHSGGEDPINPESLSIENNERLQWLNNAMNNLGIDIVRELAKGIDTMKTGDLTSIEQDMTPYEDTLEILCDYVDNLDYAKDFHKLGGYSIFASCFSSPHNEIRWRAANLIAELTQNNPYCQEAAVNEGILAQLLNLLDKDSCELVKIKAMYAVSAITRDCPIGYSEFEKLDGWSIILRAVQSKIGKLCTKACFFMSAMCTQCPGVKKTLTNMGMVTQLASLLHTPHESTHEHIVFALLLLVRDNKEAQLECCKAELKLQQVLNLRLEGLKGKEEHAEELEYWNELNKLCFIDDTEADR